MVSEKLNMNTKETPPQQVYIIQLSHNVQFESQAIPLQMLENDIDGDLILPLLQQKLGQHLQVFVEPQKELTDISSTTCQKEDIKNEEDFKNHEKPINATNIVDQNHFLHQIPNNELHTHTKEPSIPFTVKVEPVIKQICEDPKSTVEEKVIPKQKIRNYIHISDTIALPRAVAVLPAALYISTANLVFPRRTLSSRIRFGPVQGIRRILTRSEAAELSYNSTSPVFLLNHDKEHVIHIDVTDKDKSNWLGLLPLGEVATASANVWLYEDNNELYAITVKPLPARTPLKLGYSKKYSDDHNIPPDRPVFDLETASSVQWWCNECERALATEALLLHHTNVYHKDKIKPKRLSYRCKFCRRPFGRLFTVKRHMRSFCPKRPIKTDNSQQPTDANSKNVEPDINSALEDNRIPSDESFQNFTNSLDFSTNLFDTDRMAGLDISGHSRADSELNPYSIGFRDDNDLGFTKLTNGSEPVQSNETNQENNTPILDTCTYCNQVVAKGSQGKHLRQCPSRLICECGRVFRHKRSLAIHIHKSHPTVQGKQLDKDQESEEDKEMAYKCQECLVSFKRRGMLVNHLWRLHKTISTMPVEKKVKRYPCVACPKIYGSAAKRNKHVLVHHPGSEKLRGRSIEGGVKKCQPASCTECPRQYASRAKLLQHIRSHHPHLANNIYKQEMDRKSKKVYKKNTETGKYISTGSRQHFTFH